jgi:hypothetical protein
MGHFPIFRVYECYFMHFLTKYVYTGYKYRILAGYLHATTKLTKARIGRLPRPDIVHFRSACRGTEIFLRHGQKLRTWILSMCELS